MSRESKREKVCAIMPAEEKTLPTNHNPNTSEPRNLLQSVFGYSSFRDNQAEVIEAVLAGRDVFAAMPTGGGKSLCYQIPGLLLKGLTVVISPLIALMKDQVEEAAARGIPAVFLNSTLEPAEKREIYGRLHRGEIKLLYLSPERLAVEGYLEHLRSLQVAFFAVDEAHCLSEWGHDFRPDYLVLSQLRRQFPSVPLAAFTATATARVQSDIIRILNLKNPLTIRASFDRRELSYFVRPKRDVLTQIAAYIKGRPGEPGIVYRLSRKDVEKTAAHLIKRGIAALPYHAGFSKEERSYNQECFNNDEVDVIVATTAFGMGINKNNIRYVIHGDLPKSMEGYYQETGRAGRDGVEADCILYFSTGDIARQNYFIQQMTDQREQEKSRANLQSLVRFATVRVCRRKQILAYFDEQHPGECGGCDVCCDDSETLEATEDAQKVLSAVIRTQEGFGINHIIDIVWGADTEKIRSRGHDQLKTFGVGRDKNKKWWRGIVSELIAQEALFRNSDRYNVLCLTEKGRRILFGKEAFSISSLSVSHKPEPSPRRGSASGSPADGSLLKKLKEIRTLLARQKNCPPYIIFSDKTLKDMASLKPQNEEDFLLVSGVGEKKQKEYAPHFLPVIRENQ